MTENLTVARPENVRRAEFGADDFKAIADNYGSHIVPKANTKKKVQIAALVDLIGILTDEETDNYWTQALEVREELRRMEREGSGYIPEAALGFGSDNSSTLARHILGKSESASVIRTKFRKLGK